jgi:hypothetical protein
MNSGEASLPFKDSLSSSYEDKHMNIVYQYFTLLGNGDQIDDVLDMFADDDPIVYEPFSKENNLQGKAAIKSFLQVATMANRVLEKTID